MNIWQWLVCILCVVLVGVFVLYINAEKSKRHFEFVANLRLAQMNLYENEKKALQKELNEQREYCDSLNKMLCEAEGEKKKNQVIVPIVKDVEHITATIELSNEYLGNKMFEEKAIERLKAILGENAFQAATIVKREDFKNFTTVIGADLMVVRK